MDFAFLKKSGAADLKAYGKVAAKHLSDFFIRIPLYTAAMIIVHIAASVFGPICAIFSKKHATSIVMQLRETAGKLELKLHRKKEDDLVKDFMPPLYPCFTPLLGDIKEVDVKKVKDRETYLKEAAERNLDVRAERFVICDQITCNVPQKGEHYITPHAERSGKYTKNAGGWVVKESGT